MKSNKATVRQRVEEVLSLRLLGAEFPDIRQHASQQQWGVSDRQLWRYIAASDANLARTLERDRQKLLNRHTAQRRALYARAMAASDYRTALAVLRDEGELLALYPAKRTEVSGKDAGPVLLHIVEEIVGQGAAAPLQGIVEEVVPNDGSGSSDTGTDNPVAPGPTGLPQE
jgi:hypothetical protein